MRLSPAATAPEPMLREAGEWLLTPCSGQARRWGYLTQQVSLAARARRCRPAWRGHLEACHQLVHEAMARVPGPAGQGRVVVAGAGLLLEVPLSDLLARFAQVVLVDMVHPWPVRWAARRWPQIQLVAADLSAVLIPLEAVLAAGDGRPLPDPDPASLPGLGPVDLVISANLLSQLPLLPLDGVVAGRYRYPEDALTAFAQRIIHGHLNWMCHLGGVACLFTDRESRLEHAGAVEDRDDSLFGAILPAPQREWTWVIAPAPECDRHRDWVNQMSGWVDLRAVWHPVRG